eukprot:6035-Amphidinium_carterae.1
MLHLTRPALPSCCTELFAMFFAEDIYEHLVARAGKAQTKTFKPQSDQDYSRQQPSTSSLAIVLFPTNF